MLKPPLILGGHMPRYSAHSQGTYHFILDADFPDQPYAQAPTAERAQHIAQALNTLAALRVSPYPPSLVVQAALRQSNREN